MDKGVAQLLAFMDANPEVHEYFSLACETVLSSVSEEYGLASMQALMKRLGPVAWRQVFPCVLEFFFSNDYPGGPDGDEMWNVMEAFLDAPASANLLPEQRQYLTALRRSYMSVYRVVAVEPDVSLTLENVVEPGDPVRVFEKSATRSLKPGHVLGARLCRQDDGKILLAGGVLLIDAERVEDLVETIRIMHQATLSMARLSKGKDRIRDEDAERLCRGLWVSLIVEDYVRDALEQEELAGLLKPVVRKRSAVTGKKKSVAPAKSVKKTSPAAGKSAKSGRTRVKTSSSVH